LNYYNENNPYVVQWLRNLIKAKAIPNGIVDDRSIKDVVSKDLKGFIQCHFFAGIAGWSLALKMARWPEDKPVWTGSCPCQPFSVAGKKKGYDDDRHLWPTWRSLIEECQPSTVFGEQVAGNGGLAWFADVSLDLENLNYVIGAADLPVAGLSAPHIRQRLWWVANSNKIGLAMGIKSTAGQKKIMPIEGQGSWDWKLWEECRGGKKRAIGIEPGVYPLAPRLPENVGQLQAYGNSIAPPLAAVFIRAFMEMDG